MLITRPFSGSKYGIKLDAKGRLQVPTKWRAVFQNHWTSFVDERTKVAQEHYGSSSAGSELDKYIPEESLFIRLELVGKAPVLHLVTPHKYYALMARETASETPVQSTADIKHHEGQSSYYSQVEEVPFKSEDKARLLVQIPQQWRRQFFAANPDIGLFATSGWLEIWRMEDRKAHYPDELLTDDL